MPLDAQAMCQMFDAFAAQRAERVSPWDCVLSLERLGRSAAARDTSVSSGSGSDLPVSRNLLVMG